MHCRNILHHVRRLRALIDRQPCLRSVPVGHHGARLQRDAGMAPENEVGFDHLVGLREGPIDLPGIVVALEGEIVAKRSMDDRRRRIERRAHIRDRLKFFILD